MSIAELVREPDVPLQLSPLVPVTVQLAESVEVHTTVVPLPFCTSPGVALSVVVGSGAQTVSGGAEAEQEPEH